MVRRGHIKIDKPLSLKGGIAVGDTTDMAASTYHNPIDGDPMVIIHQAAIKILSTSGIILRHKLWRDEILEAGGSHLANGRIGLDEKIILRALSTAKKIIPRPAQDKKFAFSHDTKKIFFAISSQASHIYDADLEKTSHRPIDLPDVIALTKLAHILPLYDMVGFFAKPDLLAKESGSVLKAYQAMIKNLYDHNGKVFSINLYNHHLLPELTKTFPNLTKLASLSLQSFLPNLSLDSDIADSFFYAVKQNMVIDNIALTIAGATAPATIAGSITLNLAMNLASLTLAQIISPGIGFSFGFMPYASDLKQGTITTGSAETILLQQLAIKVARFYQIPSIVSSSQTSSKLPDIQAGVEKSLGLLALTKTAMAEKCGVVISQTAGLLGDLQIISQQNFITDHDMLAMVKRMMHPDPINPDTMQTDVIHRVLEKGSHFFAEPETRQVMKSHYLYPMAQDRLSLSSWLAAGKMTADKLAGLAIKQIYKKP
ncbi:MAG: trimethylamine methyltransferase family protein [Alphaproteobacteria bacterium]